MFKSDQLSTDFRHQVDSQDSQSGKLSITVASAKTVHEGLHLTVKCSGPSVTHVTSIHNYVDQIQ